MEAGKRRTVQPSDVGWRGKTEVSRAAACLSLNLRWGRTRKDGSWKEQDAFGTEVALDWTGQSVST